MWPECRFGGEEIRKVECELCGGNKKLVAIRACSVFGECSESHFTLPRKIEVCSPFCKHRRLVNMAETEKSLDRRKREGWFEKYITAPVIDIGCATDPITDDCRRYDRDLGDGDCTFCRDIADESYQTVYASHVLEHVYHPLTAIQNWVRILKPGGRLIICVPHRDLYEKKQLLPSRWNGEHKTFWLPFKMDPPNTFSLFHTVEQADQSLTIESIRVLDDGYSSNGDEHSSGEYSIELIGRKPQ